MGPIQLVRDARSQDRREVRRAAGSWEIGICTRQLVPEEAASPLGVWTFGKFRSALALAAVVSLSAATLGAAPTPDIVAVKAHVVRVRDVIGAAVRLAVPMGAAFSGTQ